MANLVPINLDPAHIGKIVSVQMFERETYQSPALDLDSLITLVGTLKGYSQSKTETTFLLDGGNLVQINNDNSYVEFYCLAGEN